jgi:hypothetical protein
MRKIGVFISPVLPVSIGIFVISCILAGTVGPCGPNGRFGAIYLIGYPVGFIGTIVGAVLSFIRTLKYLNTRSDKKDSNKKL